MDNIVWLEQFYLRLCDGDWEHSYGCKVDTIDNPGWSLKFDLDETVLESASFVKIHELRSENDWVICKKENSKFIAYGGPQNLNEMLNAFRDWVEKNLDSKASPWAE